MPAEQFETQKDSAPLAEKPMPTNAPEFRGQAGITEKHVEKKMLSPAQWLIAIDELIKQGELDDARKSLDNFQKRFPNYPLEKRFLDLIQEKRVDK